jgi:hypothetical protein
MQTRRPTTWFDRGNTCILPARHVYVFINILRINSYYFRSKESRPTMGPTQPLLNSCPELSRHKVPEAWNWLLDPSNAEVTESVAQPPLPLRLRSLRKDNFTAPLLTFWFFSGDTGGCLRGRSWICLCYLADIHTSILGCLPEVSVHPEGTVTVVLLGSRENGNLGPNWTLRYILYTLSSEY